MANKTKVNRKDYITNKVLLVFTLALAGVLVLMFIYRLLNYGSTFTTGYTILRVSGVLSIAGMVLGISLWWHERKTGQDTEFKVFKGSSVFLFALVCGLCVALILNFYVTAIKALYAVLPAGAVMYLIFHAYQREFFVITLVSGVGGIGLWAMYRALSGLYAAYAPAIFGMIVLFCVAVSALTFVVGRQKGVLKIGGKSHVIFGRDSKTAFVHLACAVLTIFALVSLVCGAATAYYLMLGIFGYLFIMGVYFTVKLM